MLRIGVGVITYSFELHEYILASVHIPLCASLSTAASSHGNLIKAWNKCSTESGLHKIKHSPLSGRNMSTTGNPCVCGVGLNSSFSLFPPSISICNSSSVLHWPFKGKRLFFTIRAKTNNGAFPTDRSMDRQKALEVAMNDINSCFGKGSVTRLGSAGGALVETFPSGCLTLDLALGGGLPKGRIVEIYGPESSGKTTLALHAIAEIQKLGGNAMLVDAEHVFDPYYSKALGVDVESLIVCQPDSGEMALETADRMCRSGAVDLICIDSVAALTPRAEIEGEIGTLQIGLQARLMSQALRKMSGNASKAGCTLIFLNQIRHKIGVFYGSPEVTSGGIALKFFASLRLEIRSAGKIKSLKGDEDIGVRTRIRVQKSKVSRPYKQAEFDIIFGEGVNRLGCILDCSEMLDIVSKKGSWYSYEDIRLGQGRDRALQYLQETPLLCVEIEKAVRARMSEDLTVGRDPSHGISSFSPGEIQLESGE